MPNYKLTRFTVHRAYIHTYMHSYVRMYALCTVNLVSYPSGVLHTQSGSESLIILAKYLQEGTSNTERGPMSTVDSKDIVLSANE